MISRSVLLVLLILSGCRGSKEQALVERRDTTSLSPLSARDALSQARRRWAARPFPNYDIAVAGQFGGSPCLQSMYVEGDSVVREYKNTCIAHSALTVPELFWFAEQGALQEGGCAPSGCGCEGIIRLAAEYDEEVGYPRRLRLYPDTLSERYQRERQKRLAEGIGCPDVGLVQYNFIVADFRGIGPYRAD